MLQAKFDAQVMSDVTWAEKKQSRGDSGTGEGWSDPQEDV